MSNIQLLADSSSFKSSNPRQKPILAWTAILGLIFLSILCLLAGLGSILRLVFPLASLAVGLLLYLRYPILYIGFTWWIWFITPLLRRLIDYRNGWDAQGLILVAPFLVTMITLITFLKYLPRSYRLGGLPFILAFAGVFYGFMVGLIQNPPMTVVRVFIDWVTPLLFAFHLFINWRHYPLYRRVTENVFVWCVLITGAYGIFQFLVAPDWDTSWLINTKLTSQGIPKPLGLRVWSTMHSSGPYAVVLMAGLLLLFTSKNKLRIPAAAVGYLAFLLSLVRSAWGGWLVGVITVVTSLKAHLQMRLILTIFVLGICVTPLVTLEPFSDAISDRFNSFSDIQQDDSFQARSSIYETQLNLAFSSALGKGIGSTFFINEKGILESIVIDSGYLDMLFTLGWFGALPYFTGMILLFFDLFQGSELRSDSFASTARAISLSIFVQLLFTSLMLSLTGVVFWGFLAMGVAARKYYQYEHNLKLKI